MDEGQPFWATVEHYDPTNSKYCIIILRIILTAVWRSPEEYGTECVKCQHVLLILNPSKL